MANENIEQTIYRLSIDGSAYTQGVDSLAASTQKFTASQEKANAKLIELQKSQSNYKKILEETTAVIKANEKETLELTKELNALKDAGKGASAEANRLKAALRDISVNTKEFKAEATILKGSLTDTTNQIKIQTKELQAAERAQGGFTSGLQKTYTGLSRIAALIPGLGIGSLVALIAGPVVNAFGQWYDKITQVNNAQDKQKKLINEIFADAGKNAGRDIAHLEVLRSVITDLNEPLNKRLLAVREYNSLADEGNKIDEKQINNINLINSAISRQIEQIGKLALAKAFENKLGEQANKVVELDLKLKNTKPKAEGIVSGDFDPNNPIQALERQLALRREVEAENPKLVKELEAAKQEFQDLLNFSREFLDFGDVTKKIKTKKEGKSQIANIYEQELQKLKADIAKLDEKGFTNEATITKAIEEDFKKRSLAFEKAFKNKQLTATQLTSLTGYLSDLQKLTLEQNLKIFREQKAAYLAQINTELNNLQIEEATKRIATIQDRFERERKLIISEADKTTNAIKEKRDKQIADITKAAAKNGLTVADIAPQISKIKDTYSKLLDDIEIIKNQKLQQLSFDTFERLSEDAKRLLDSGNLGISQGSVINIQKQTELFLQGKISYKQYQKELTEIARFEVNERFRLEKLFLESEIRVRQDKLKADKNLTNEQITRLEDEIRRLQQQLADAEKGNAISNASNTQKDKTDKIATIVQYSQAIGSLIDSVVGFWQKANEAESKALDRSITLQQRRVDAAQRIAERGNAQYLKAEEDRLTELEIKRENAARKQLGIDAALQASQILVAITGAVAKIATPGVGIAETIGSIAVIVGALATGYGLVRSLQGNQPTFFTGTKDTGPGGNVDGKGGFTATLHPHEAVTPADKNKAYHPTISAIHDGTIPAETLNTFVKNYHQIKPVAMPNYDKMKETAELSIGHDGRMAVLLLEHTNLLKENNELQRAILKKKGVHAELNVDKNGVGMMVTEYMEQLEINKRI